MAKPAAAPSSSGQPPLQLLPTDDACVATFIRIMQCKAFMLSLIGHNIFDPQFRRDWRFRLLITIIGCFIASCLYTMSRSASAGEIIDCASYLSFGLQGPAKVYVCAIEYDGVMLALSHRICRFYKRILTCGNELHRRKVRHFSELFRRLMLAYGVLCSAVAVAIICFPVLAYYVWHTEYVMLMLASQLPGVDFRTVGGYAVTTVFHLLCLGIVLCGNSPADAMFLNLVMHAYTAAMCLEREVEVLNERLAEVAVTDDKRGRRRRAEVGRLMRRVLRSHREYDE